MAAWKESSFGAEPIWLSILVPTLSSWEISGNLFNLSEIHVQEELGMRNGKQQNMWISGPNIFTLYLSVSCLMEKAMACHFSTLAWKIPWTEEPSRLVHGVAKSRTRLSDFTFTFHFHALEKEMATYSSVLAWESQGRVSLVGCCLWSRAELDTTEMT